MVGDAGWARIGSNPQLAAWAAAALGPAMAAIAADPAGWRCGGTWHVGLDALPNDSDGTVATVRFPWESVPLSPMPLHRAQISVIRPGYPQPWDGESPAAFAYRQTRDAAHLDGLLPVGPLRRRFVHEPHAWILGVALNVHAAGASPLTVWEGSHLIMRRALLQAMQGTPERDWQNVDVTDAYQAARREVFATCRRIPVALRAGEASLLHRLVLHGMAPWEDGASAPPEGRMIAYFRPMLPSVADWLA